MEQLPRNQPHRANLGLVCAAGPAGAGVGNREPGVRRLEPEHVERGAVQREVVVVVAAAAAIRGRVKDGAEGGEAMPRTRALSGGQGGPGCAEQGEEGCGPGERGAALRRQGARGRTGPATLRQGRRGWQP